MRYTYCCTCADKGEEKNALKWMEEHSMKDHGKLKITCPNCGEKAKQFFASAPEFYFKGACYQEKNKHDCKRHMDFHTLKEADPYEEHRLPGAKDELIKKYEDSFKSTKIRGKTGPKVEMCVGVGCVKGTNVRCPHCGRPLCPECEGHNFCPCAKDRKDPPTREELTAALIARKASE